MDILVKYFEKQKAKYINNLDFQNTITMAWYAFDKYYLLTDQVPAYGAALLLHSSRWRSYIQAHWKAVWQKVILAKVKKVWQE